MERLDVGDNVGTLIGMVIVFGFLGLLVVSGGDCTAKETASRTETCTKLLTDQNMPENVKILVASKCAP